jgi:hypothetical protein
MSIVIVDSAAPVTEEDLAQAERRMRCAIPPAFRSFLLAHNGGRPIPGVFAIHGVGSGEVVDESRVRSFFGIHIEHHYNSLEDVVEIYRGRLPSNIIPIADDPFGNVIGLAIDGEQEGAVYFWDHELEVEPGETPHPNSLLFVAPSFEEFLNGLHH